MTRDEMLQVQRAVAEAMSGDLDRLDDLMSPELAAEFKDSMRRVRNGLPDYSIEVVEVYADETAQAATTRFLCRGTHRGEMYGVALTGNRVEFTGLVQSGGCNSLTPSSP